MIGDAQPSPFCPDSLGVDCDESVDPWEAQGPSWVAWSMARYCTEAVS